MTWNGQVSRRYNSGPSVADAGTAAALTPAGGVYSAMGANLKVTAPVSGLTVNVAAGYCNVPSATAGQAGYRFGLMTGGALTVAANATGSTRKDLVLATVNDLGSSSSTAVIQYVVGTTSLPSIPSSSIVLAEVDVTNAAANITSGMITDKRGFVCAPGGILHLPTAAAAIAAPPTQFFYEIDTAALVQGTGTAGSVTGYQSGGGGVAFAYVSSPSSWSLFSGQTRTLASVAVTGDGSTDFEISYSIPDLSISGSDAASLIGIAVDGHRVDGTWAALSGKSGGASPAVSATFYTSSAHSTTLTAGAHTISLTATYFASGTSSNLTVFAPAILRVAPVVI